MPRKKGAVTSSAHKAKIAAGVKAYNKGGTKKRDGVVSNNQFPRNASGKKVGGSSAKGKPLSQKAQQANIGPNTASGRQGTEKKAILEGKPGGVRTIREEKRPKTPDKTVTTSDSDPKNYGGLSTGQKKVYSRSKKTGEVTKKDPKPKSEMPGGSAAGKGISKEESKARQKAMTESRKAAGLSTTSETSSRQDGHKTTPPRSYAPPGVGNNDRIWTEKKNQQDRIGNVRYGKHGGGYGVKANYGGKNTGAKPGSKNVSNNKSQRHFENKDISPGSKNNPTPQRRNKPKRKRIFRPKGG